MMDGRKIFGAFTIAIAVFFFWPAVIGTWQEVSALRSAVAERETLLKQRQDILANINAAYAHHQTKLTQQDGQKFSALVPVHKDTAEIISAIQDMSTEAGIVISQIRITENKPTGTEQFKTLTLALEMKGSYASLREFLTNLEKYVRLLNVNAIAISSDPNTTGKLKFSVRADAYFLK